MCGTPSHYILLKQNPKSIREWAERRKTRNPMNLKNKVKSKSSLNRRSLPSPNKSWSLPSPKSKNRLQKGKHPYSMQKMRSSIKTPMRQLQTLSLTTNRVKYSPALLKSAKRMIQPTKLHNLSEIQMKLSKQAQKWWKKRMKKWRVEWRKGSIM